MLDIVNIHNMPVIRGSKNAMQALVMVTDLLEKSMYRGEHEVNMAVARFCFDFHCGNFFWGGVGFYQALGIYMYG